MKGYFLLLILFLVGLFVYQKFIAKKVGDGTTNLFGFSQDAK